MKNKVYIFWNINKNIILIILLNIYTGIDKNLMEQTFHNVNSYNKITLLGSILFISLNFNLNKI
jgi:hypothetical protein